MRNSRSFKVFIYGLPRESATLHRQTYGLNLGTAMAPLATGVIAVRQSDSRYPQRLRVHLGNRAPEFIYARGNLAVLQHKTLALFCSEKCPGTLILQTYDLARQLRDDGVSVIGGFHSPMEKDCFSLLLRGRQPVIWCLAKRLAAKRLPKEFIKPLSDGRLLMLSPFGKRLKRVTENSAYIRNEFVIALADKIFVTYAAPGGMTERLFLKASALNKSILTFNSPYNTDLLERGAHPYSCFDSIAELLSK